MTRTEHKLAAEEIMVLVLKNHLWWKDYRTNILCASAHHHAEMACKCPNCDKGVVQNGICSYSHCNECDGKGWKAPDEEPKNA